MLRDMNVTFETAKRLKEAWFPQPKKTEKGQEWFANDEPILFAGCEQVEVRMFGQDMVFAPTATDILAHLPGWYLTHASGVWVCLSFDDEGNPPDSFRHTNPAEAVAKAWFFEQGQPRKMSTQNSRIREHLAATCDDHRSKNRFRFGEVEFKIDPDSPIKGVEFAEYIQVSVYDRETGMEMVFVSPVSEVEFIEPTFSDE